MARFVQEDVVKTVPSRPTLLPGGRQPQTTTRRRCDGDAGRQVPPRQKIGAHPRYPPPTERKLVHVFSRPLPLSRLRFNLDGSRLANANVQDKQLTPITSRAFSAFHPKDTPKFCFLKQQSGKCGARGERTSRRPSRAVDSWYAGPIRSIHTMVGHGLAETHPGPRPDGILLPGGYSPLDDSGNVRSSRGGGRSGRSERMDPFSSPRTTLPIHPTAAAARARPAPAAFLLLYDHHDERSRAMFASKYSEFTTDGATTNTRKSTSWNLTKNLTGETSTIHARAYRLGRDQTASFHASKSYKRFQELDDSLYTLKTWIAEPPPLFHQKSYKSEHTIGFLDNALRIFLSNLRGPSEGGTARRSTSPTGRTKERMPTNHNGSEKEERHGNAMIVMPTTISAMTRAIVGTQLQSIGSGVTHIEGGVLHPLAKDTWGRTCSPPPETHSHTRRLNGDDDETAWGKSDISALYIDLHADEASE
ncbi:hypothetical protein GEV33_006126 [Tenebrio molitor]|uniref:Uncharacterized protein n=1 Tax=Tenebrio molitor TaxID=7067 RepID=A0A8J6HLM5_TENMO|nr:hypothetical protein GEV33_006126 [Tenebrio molitor]